MTISRRLQRLARSVRLPRREPRRDAHPTQRDKTVTRRLYTAFERDLEMAEMRGLHFYVQNGTVTLYGAIRHTLDRDFLVAFVRQVPGVIGVVDQLQVVERRFQEDLPVAVA